MKKKTFKLKKILIPILILAGLVGGMFAARAYISSGKTAAVIPVSMIADTWIEDSSAGYGQVSQGGVQYVYPDTSMLIQKVFVSTGDVVNKGDPLVQYDATQAALQVDSYRIQYEMTKRDLAEAKETLAYYKTFKPYQEPIPKKKDVDKKILITKAKNGELKIVGKHISVEKKDSTEYYVVDLDLNTQINMDTFKYIFEYERITEELAQGNYVEHGSPASGNGLDDTNEEGKKGKNLTRVSRYIVFRVWATVYGYDSVQIATLRTRVAIDPEKTKAWIGSVCQNGNNYYSFSEIFDVQDGEVRIKSATGEFNDSLVGSVMVATSIEKYAYVEPELPPEEESHTQEEIDEMIQSQTQLIRRLENSVAQAELAWKRAKQTATDGVVRAYDAGTVTSVGDPFAVSGDEPFITVQSGHGYEVTSTISELQLGTVKVGDQVSIQMWSNGMTYTGTITKISPYPTKNNMSYYGGGGGNVSYYEYTAELDCEDELQPWDGGEIRFVTDGSSSKAEFALQACYVREENGRSYVLKAGDDDRLVKQYVEAGRLLYGGYSVEILGGLSLEDSIAFPYGKSAVEGAKVDRESGMGGMYW